MKILIIIISSIFILGCNKSVSTFKYNSGWSKAKTEGCECNSNLTQIDNSVEAREGLGWADGYVDGCISYKRENKCD